MGTIRCLVLATVLAGAGACIEFEGPAFSAEVEEYLLRIDAQADTIELISIQHRLRAGDGDVLAHLARIWVGRRLFPAEGGFISWDLDDLKTPPPNQMESDKDRKLRSLVDELRVDDVVLGLDGEGRVTLWRRVRFTKAAAWLDCWQSAEAPENGPPFTLGKFPTLDERTLELAVAAYGRGERFLSLRGDSFVLDMPSTAANAARCIAHVAGDWDQFGTVILANLRELESGSERLRARIGPDTSGWIRLAWKNESHADEPAGHFLTATELATAGLHVEPSPEFAARLATVAP